jgi:transposase
MSNDSARDEQWERIRDHFPEENIADGRPGRKPIPARCVLEAVLWILNTGAQWHMLPQSYPNYKTVHRRFQTWCRDEVLRRVLTDVANELRDRGALNEEECFIDATLCDPEPEGAHETSRFHHARRRGGGMAARGAGAAVGPGAADRCAGRTLIGAQQDCVPRSSFALAFFDLDLLLLLRDLRWLW